MVEKLTSEVILKTHCFDRMWACDDNLVLEYCEIGAWIELT